jgi:radical SAM enzyme (TIGR01210 family)
VLIDPEAARGDARPTALPSEAQGDQWILERRGARNGVDPRRPYSFLLEQEASASGEAIDVVTIFLTNRECPWRCVMCDLWKNTLTETVPIGAIPEQIDFALARLSPARQVKLYNSGSFFDRAAIPAEDYPAIAERVAKFERVIVECHPALIGERVLRFRDLLRGQLEVAIGLETAHPETLALLNKRMTVEQFASAAQFLQKHEIALRVFILVKPPFQSDEEALEWCQRSVQFAFDCGATAVSLIPTRFGNGALEAVAQEGEFAPPTLSLFETAVENAFTLERGRVFADLWDLEKFSKCSACFAARADRLRRMNLLQTVHPRVICDQCGIREIVGVEVTRLTSDHCGQHKSSRLDGN